MRGCRREALLRSGLAGVAALATHAALLLGMPDAAKSHAATHTPLWLTTVETRSAESARISSALADTPETARRESPTRRPLAHVSRVRTSVRANVAEAVHADEVSTAAVASESGLLTVRAPAGDLASGAAQPAGLAAGTAVAGAAAGSMKTRPALLPTRDPCVGYFPASAHVAHGRVQIQVRVDASGRARESEVVMEAPRGQDFGRAARACAAALRFAPARDASGVAVAAEAKLELHFHRT